MPGDLQRLSVADAALGVCGRNAQALPQLCQAFLRVAGAAPQHRHLRPGGLPARQARGGADLDRPVAGAQRHTEQMVGRCQVGVFLDTGPRQRHRSARTALRLGGLLSSDGFAVRGPAQREVVLERLP